MTAMKEGKPCLHLPAAQRTRLLKIARANHGLASALALRMAKLDDMRLEMPSGFFGEPTPQDEWALYNAVIDAHRLAWGDKQAPKLNSIEEFLSLPQLRQPMPKS